MPAGALRLARVARALAKVGSWLVSYRTLANRVTVISSRAVYAELSVLDVAGCETRCPACHLSPDNRAVPSSHELFAQSNAHKLLQVDCAVTQAQVACRSRPGSRGNVGQAGLAVESSRPDAAPHRMAARSSYAERYCLERACFLEPAQPPMGYVRCCIRMS
jgi:hypothetical protein